MACNSRSVVMDWLDFLVGFCSEYGYLGMGVLAFLSGSVLPVTSEVLLVFFLSVGLNAFVLTLVAALGNSLGGVVCFLFGRLANKERVIKMFKITPRRMERADKIISRYGYWAALISFVPVLGETLLVLLGIMRVPLWKMAAVMSVGKFIRYGFITLSYLGIMQAVG